MKCRATSTLNTKCFQRERSLERDGPSSRDVRNLQRTRRHFVEELVVAPN